MWIVYNSRYTYIIFQCWQKTNKKKTVEFTFILFVLFSVFNLGERKTCDTDYLEVYDVDHVTRKSSFVAKYCGGVSVFVITYYGLEICILVSKCFIQKYNYFV